MFRLGLCGRRENRFNLGRLSSSSANAQAWGINSRGDIVGYYVGPPTRNNHGFLLNGGPLYGD